MCAKRLKTKTLTTYALLTALSVILSYVESFFILPAPVPGLKLGLANIVSLFLLYSGPLWAAMLVSAARCALVAFAFSNGLFSLLFSVSGAFASLLVMAGMRRVRPLGVYAVSMLGAITHNLAQMAVAALTLQTGAFLAYMPVLLLSGAACGVLTGACAHGLLRALPGMRVKQ